MPSLDEHMRRSSERTGQRYMQLNEWLDGDLVPFLQRLERHLRAKKYSRYVTRRWGDEGFREYRNHLHDDLRAFTGALALILRKSRATQTDEGGETRDEQES